MGDLLAEAAACGLSELVVRVSRYGEDMENPAAWQAIAKFRGSERGPWSVGIRATPEAAVRAALEDRKRQLTPPAESVCHSDILQLELEDPFA